jgi:hypothetical protein
MISDIVIVDPILGRPIPLAVALEAERQRATFFYKWTRSLLEENRRLLEERDGKTA